MPAISAVQGIVDGLKTVEIRVNHLNQVYAAKMGLPGVYLDQPITRG